MSFCQKLTDVSIFCLLGQSLPFSLHLRAMFMSIANKDPCTQPIYPPGYKPTCGMLEKQWTFNSTTGQCVAFAYSPCGEERKGYDVFTTEEECVQTCMHRGTTDSKLFSMLQVRACGSVYVI